jgi:hypothetical protein
MDTVTVNKVRTIVYTAIGFRVGLTDLVLTVKAPSGTNPTATFTDLGNGSYKASYTPAVVGVFTENVASVSNGDQVADSVNVVAFDVMDVKSDLDAFETTTNATLVALQAQLTQVLNKISKGGYIN